MRIPRWLELQQEIDYRLFLLGQIYNKLPKSAIEKMIDAATGHDKKMQQEAESLMKEVEELKAEYYKITKDSQ